MKTFKRKWNLIVICLVETRVKAEKASSIKEYIAHKWGFINNHGGHELVKIWLCWDSDTIDIKVNQSSDPVIHCAIIVVEGKSYFASFIYGFLIAVLLGGCHGQMIFVASSIRLAKNIGFFQLA